MVNSYNQSAALADPFSEVLHGWIPPNWFAGLAELSSPWGISVPERMASLFVVLGDRCLLTFEECEAQQMLQDGDVLLLTQGDAIRLQDRPDSPTMPLRADFGKSGGHLVCAHEAAPSTRPSGRLIYGCFSVACHGFQALTAGFPPVVRLNAESCPDLQGCQALAGLVANEQSLSAPGCREIVDRLVQVVLFQSIRAFLVQDSTGSRDERTGNGTPWLKAALDESIGPALALIHRHPEEPWSVTSLAGRVNMSKSSFSERFRESVGKPPLHYLTEYRMQKACQLLCDTELGVKEIASLVGYESASSFSNAFKRWTGKAPGAFRRNGQPQAQSSAASNQQDM